MSTTILEGVDNEVVLAFVVLFAIAVVTVVYFFNTSGRTSNNLLNSWQYLRNLFEREFEDTRREDRQSPDGTSTENNDSNNEGGQLRDQDRQQTVQPATHGNNQDNSNFAGPSSVQTEGSHGEGPRHRAGLGTHEEPAGGSSESRAEPSSPSPTSEQLSLRIKHHEVEANYVVDANTTIGELKRLGFPEEVAQGRRVRLIYSGRLLQNDNASLSSYGITNFSVIHAQISDMLQPNHSQQGQREDEIELDISRLFIPLLTFILCGCWYGLISYRQLFNTTSTAILVIVTAAYAFMVYVMLG